MAGRRWMELLEGVRKELGEGRIRGAAGLCRFEFSSVAGNWELRPGGDVEGSTGTCLIFSGKKRFPAPLQIVPGSSGSGLKTGDERFDGSSTISSSEPAKWNGLLSPGIQGSLLRLWALHPMTRLTVTKESIRMTLPGTPHDRETVLSFLFHGGACVGEFLHAMDARA